jgi:hypothetical protein
MCSTLDYYQIYDSYQSGNVPIFMLTLNTVKLSGWIRIYPYESSFVVVHTAGRSVLRVGCGLTTPVCLFVIILHSAV